MMSLQWWFGLFLVASPLGLFLGWLFVECKPRNWGWWYYAWEALLRCIVFLFFALLFFAAMLSPIIGMNLMTQAWLSK